MPSSLKLYDAMCYGRGIDPVTRASIASADIKRAAWAADKFLKKDPTVVWEIPMFTLSDATVETNWGQDGSGNNIHVSADLTATDWQTV